MTAKEIFKKSLRDAEEYAKKNELNFIVYMSGKKNAHNAGKTLDRVQRK